jgi:hypothetical protein
MVVIMKYSVIDTERKLKLEMLFCDLIAYITFINSVRNEAVSRKW